MARIERLPFIAGATFVAMRDTPIAGIEVNKGDVITQDMIDHLGMRRMRQLYNARWIAMAGNVAPSTSEPEKPEPKVGLLSTPEGAQGTPEHDQPYSPPADADDADIVPVALGGGELTAPELAGEATGVYHEGFGRWFKRDDAGNKIGDKMTKAQAEATSLPVVAVEK